VTISTSATSRWPARAAFCAAAIFIGASGAINTVYGWKKGSDLASCVTWAVVAGGVACLFALSWPALIRSCDARRWSAAAMALAALLLSGSYSVTAALGSAAGGRVQAERTETAAMGAQERAQAAYDDAKAALAKLKPSRPLAEMRGLVEAAPCYRRVIVTNGQRVTTCTKPAALLAELGRAQERERLQAALDKAAEQLATAPPSVANSDSRALSRYLAAIGLDVTPDRLNDLLVLLAVLMVECGGGLSLAVGMALAGAPESRQQARADAPRPDSGHPCSPPAAEILAPGAEIGQSERQPHDTPTVRPASVRPLTVQPSGVREWLVEQGGSARTSMRRLASVLGRSPSAVHDELRRLAASGAITMTACPRGTTLALRPN
jgi:hypothetical protein